MNTICKCIICKPFETVSISTIRILLIACFDIWSLRGKYGKHLLYIDKDLIWFLSKCSVSFEAE